MSSSYVHNLRQMSQMKNRARTEELESFRGAQAHDTEIRREKNQQHKSINLVSIITGYGRALSHGLTSKEKWKPKLRKYAGITFAQTVYFVKANRKRLVSCAPSDLRSFRKFISRLTVSRLTLHHCVCHLLRSFSFIIFYFVVLLVPNPCKSCAHTSSERDLTWPKNICNLQ